MLLLCSYTFAHAPNSTEPIRNEDLKILVERVPAAAGAGQQEARIIDKEHAGRPQNSASLPIQRVDRRFGDGPGSGITLLATSRGSGSALV